MCQFCSRHEVGEPFFTSNGAGPLADCTIAGDDRRWKRFEKLVARMLETLSPDASVTYDDSIRGSLSEAARQIDVSIRRSTNESKRLAIVQCRDYKSLLDVNAVGEFD